MTTATRSLPAYGPAIVHRSALTQPASFDPSDNTLEVTWTTGAPVERFGFFPGPFIETLEVTPQALRLDRLNAGTAVLDCHDMYELAAAVGSVVPGSVRIANGEGTARLALADTPDVADTVAKIRAGHLRSVSVGYFVHAYERLAGADDEMDELRAVDWEPIEISFVTVPADPGAQVRLKDNDMTRIIDNGARRSTSRASVPPAIINRDGGRDGGARPAADELDGDEPRAPRRDDPTPRQRADRDDDRRARPGRVQMATEDRIRALCDRGNFSREFERELLEDHREEPMTEAQMLRAVNDELIERGNRESGRGTRAIDARMGDGPGESRNPRDGMARGMEDALFARMTGQAPTDAGREFMGTRMIDMARGLLEQRGERVRWMNASRVVDTMSRYGAHTTSDFPNILGNAARRYLLQVLKDYPAPLAPIVAPRTAADFRRLSLAKLGVNPSLLLVPENGEIKRGTVVDAAEGYSLNTYARIFAITRQALVNDDLGAFAAIFQGWGRAAAELEASLIAALIVANSNMSDGQPLYSNAHGNIAAGGGAITVANLGAARQAMRMQVDLDGVTLVGATPKFLVVGAAKETEAEAALTQLAAATVDQVNPFSGKLTLLVDPRLPGNAWRLFADPAAWPVIEVARLAGQEDVFVDSRVGFDVDGVETKARVDIGGAAVDWRGTYLNQGN